jgi:hypothetical protein
MQVELVWGSEMAICFMFAEGIMKESMMEPRNMSSRFATIDLRKTPMKPISR